MSYRPVNEKNERAFIFLGYPYIITQLIPGFHHIALLPRSLGLKAWIDVTRKQIRANILPTCLALEGKRCIYFYSDGSAEISEALPNSSYIVINRLKLPEDFPDSVELSNRKKALIEYEIKVNGIGSKYLLGNLTKGGRKATEDDIERLNGLQPNGIPVGLTQCRVCSEWRGECLDPSPNFKDMVMIVFCRCQNDTRCARCGEVLYDHQLNCNYYSEGDRTIWHVPGFCALNHKCIQIHE